MGVATRLSTSILDEKESSSESSVDELNSFELDDFFSEDEEEEVDHDELDSKNETKAT